MKQYKWKNIKADIINAYENGIQRRIKAKKRRWKLKERKAFLSYLAHEKKQTLLEIGAGVGKDSLYFQSHGLKVTATDFAPEFVKYCKDKELDACQLDVYDILKVGKKFDAVYALNSLLHIPKNDFELILKRIKRSLKLEGLLYLGMYGGTDFEGILEEDHCKPKRFFSFYSTKDILAIVQKYFQLEYFRHIIPFKDGGTFHSMTFQSMILRND